MQPSARSASTEPGTKFQSSTRLTRFATVGDEPGEEEHELVSILYEANEVCNLYCPGDRSQPSGVSILYEANEVCNCRHQWSGR